MRVFGVRCPGAEGSNERRLQGLETEGVRFPANHEMGGGGAFCLAAAATRANVCSREGEVVSQVLCPACREQGWEQTLLLAQFVGQVAHLFALLRVRAPYCAL